MSVLPNYSTPDATRIIVALSGPPGSGKSVVGEALERRFGATRIICSQQLEVAIRAGILCTPASESGVDRETQINDTLYAVRSMKDQGRLIPDHIVDACIEYGIQSALGRIIVIDGYPRTLAQVQTLMQMCARTFTRFHFVPFVIDASAAFCSQRIRDRACAQGRTDDQCGFTYMRRVYDALANFGDLHNPGPESVAGVLSLNSSLRGLTDFLHGFVRMEKPEDRVPPIEEVHAQTCSLMERALGALGQTRG